MQPPFNPAVVVNDILLPLCKAYSIHTVYADHYEVGFIESLIRSAGLHFEPTTKTRSELYLDPLTPLLNSRRITLPRNERLVNQIRGLERSTQKSGRDAVNHGPHSHDDAANAASIAANLALNFTLFDTSYSFVKGITSNKSSAEQEAEQRRKQSDEDARQAMYR